MYEYLCELFMNWYNSLFLLVSDTSFVWGVNFGGMSGTPYSTTYDSWWKDAEWTTPLVRASPDQAWANSNPNPPVDGVYTWTDSSVEEDVADWTSLTWATEHFGVIRLPVTWERLTTDNKSLNGFCVPTLDAIFKKYDCTFILDIHNNDQHISFKGASATSDQLAQLWGLIAERWGKYSNIWFEIYNEPPHTMDVGVWTNMVEASIDAIRGAGASNKILVDGINYTNIYNDNGNWVEDNASLVAAMKAKGDSNLAFSIHQYFDATYEGSGVGSDGATDALWDAFDALTTLLETNGFTAYLTETNILKANTELVDDTDPDYPVMSKLVSKMKATPSVWKGLCVWEINFNYNNDGGTGNIWNGPAYDSATWTAGAQSTADWFTNYLREN